MRLGALLLGISYLASKILGLIRDHILASTFGISGGVGMFQLDTYYAAFRIPDFIYTLISYGVLSAAFVPLFLERQKKENDKAAETFASQTLTLFLIGTGLAALVLFITAPFVMKIIVPGFNSIELATTVQLTRIMLITPIFFTISGVMGGIQNATHRYLGMSIAPIAYNAGIIVGVILFGKTYGVYGIAIGVIFGAMLHSAIQLPWIKKTGFKLRLVKDYWNEKTKELVRLALPRIVGMSASQFALIIDTILASGLAAGSIATMNLATNLNGVPLGMVGASIAIVGFGALSELAADSRYDEFHTLLKRTVRHALFLLIPLASGMIVLRFQIVRLLLGRGQFSWEDTILTADTLGIMLAGMIFGSLILILTRAFYALKDTKTPVIVSLICLLLNIVLAIIAVKFFSLGTYGLAAASAIAATIDGTVLIILLSNRMKDSIIDIPEIMKNIFGAAIMGGVVQLTKMSFGFLFTDIDTYFELGLQTVTATIVGIGIYFALSFILKSETIKEILQNLKKERVVDVPVEEL